MRSAPRLLPGNRVQLLENGAEYFPSLCAAIDAARREVHLQTYIFEADAAGRRVADALAGAARRGVAVHLLLDGFGSLGLPPAFVGELRLAGVEVLVFRPEVARFSLRRNRLRRMHCKLAVADGRIGFVGGINIVEDGPQGPAPRLDYAVRIEGPLVAEIRQTAARLWNRVARVTPGAARVDAGEPFAAPLPSPDGVRAALVLRDTFRHRRAIEQAYRQAIAGARREVLIANAYFLPGLRMRRALMHAAARGVRVVLLLQGRPEFRLITYATRALYGALLRSGVEIFEYHRALLHAKVAVVDGRWATVGSSNIDPFSLVLAKEANAVICDQAFAEDLRGRMLRAIESDALAVALPQWQEKRWPARATHWIAYGLIRSMAGVVGQDLGGADDF